RRLIRTRAVAGRSLEPGEEKAVHQHDPSVEIDPAPPDGGLGIIAVLGRYVVSAVHGPQGGAEGGGDIVEILVIEIAATDDEIDRADLRGDGADDRLVLDVTDRQDPRHVSSTVSRQLGTAVAKPSARTFGSKAACAAGSPWTMKVV